MSWISVAMGAASIGADLLGSSDASDASSSAAGNVGAALGPGLQEIQGGYTAASDLERPIAMVGQNLASSGLPAGQATYGGIPGLIQGAATAYNAGNAPLSPTTQYELGQITPLINQQMAARGLYNSGAANQSLSNAYANLVANNNQQAFTNYNTALGTGLQATNPLLSAGVGSAETLGGQALNSGVAQSNLQLGVGTSMAPYTQAAGSQMGAGIIGAGNALSQTIGNVGQNMGYGNMGSTGYSNGPLTTYSGGAPSGSDLGMVQSFSGFAEGGEPPVGQPALVGEKGPELFVPKQQGTIIPNQALQFMVPGSGLSGLSRAKTAQNGDDLATATGEKAYHDEVIKQHKSMGMASPYNTSIGDHLQRSAMLAGVIGAGKAKNESLKQMQGGRANA